MGLYWASCGMPVVSPRRTALPWSPPPCSSISRRSAWHPPKRPRSCCPCSACPIARHRSSGAAPRRSALQTFATLHQLLLQESQRQPLVVVVENLHWIDPTSQEYLAEVVERLPSVPLLLLVTFRPGYRPSWMEKSYATQFALPRLSPADSRRVVQAVLHPAPVPEPLLQEILAKAAGNPLFLEELAWTVREQGDLRLPPEMPTTVHAVLAARIDQLPPAAKQVLQTAAVIGTEVRMSLLQAITALPEEALWQEPPTPSPCRVPVRNASGTRPDLCL